MIFGEHAAFLGRFQQKFKVRHHRLRIVLETPTKVAQPLFTHRRQLRHLGLQVAVGLGEIVL